MKKKLKTLVVPLALSMWIACGGDPAGNDDDDDNPVPAPATLSAAEATDLISQLLRASLVNSVYSEHHATDSVVVVAHAHQVPGTEQTLEHAHSMSLRTQVLHGHPDLGIPSGPMLNHHIWERSEFSFSFSDLCSAGGSVDVSATLEGRNRWQNRNGELFYYLTHTFSNCRVRVGTPSREVALSGTTGLTVNFAASSNRDGDMFTFAGDVTGGLSWAITEMDQTTSGTCAGTDLLISASGATWDGMGMADVTGSVCGFSVTAQLDTAPPS